MSANADKLNVIYVEPTITMNADEERQQLTRFITLFAQVGFKELALNENFSLNFKNI